MANRILIVGTAPCVKDDMSMVEYLESYDLLAVGLDAAKQIDRKVKYVATNHLEDLPGIELARRAHGQERASYKVISNFTSEGVDIVVPYKPPSGSSAITGAYGALCLGYERAILCGCPLTGNAPEGNPYEAFRAGWEANKSDMIRKVYSMSGWTKELLGEPPQITIGASWDGDDYYPPEYVNRLYAACNRNMSRPFDFVLYVGPNAERPGRREALNQSIKVVQTGLPQWWSGMVFWKKNPPGVLTPSLLYLDIDQVVVGSLEDIVGFRSDNAYMKDYPSHSCPDGLENDACVSTSLLRNGSGVVVWSEYERAGRPTWDVLRYPPGPMPMAAQGVVNDKQIGMRKDLFPEEWVCSYKLEARPRGLPADCRIVAFHGRPKQHEVTDGWVWRNWYG